MIDQILADLAQSHDVIDTRPVVSFGGKFLGCNVENSLPRLLAFVAAPLAVVGALLRGEAVGDLAGAAFPPLDRCGFVFCRLFADRLSMTHDLGFQ